MTEISRMEAKVARIIGCIRRCQIDLSNEKMAQLDLSILFSHEKIAFEREVRLSKSDIIDFMVDHVGIEVKLHGANKKSVYRQLVRYASHEEIECLILVSNLSMGLPPMIGEKPIYFVSIGEGWM